MILTYVNAPLLHRLAITAKESHLMGDAELPVTRLWISPSPQFVAPDACLFASALLTERYVGRYLEITAIRPSAAAYDAFERCFPDLRYASQLDLDRTNLARGNRTVRILAQGEVLPDRQEASITVGFDDGWSMTTGGPRADQTIRSNFVTLTRTPALHARIASILIFTAEWDIGVIEMSLADAGFSEAWMLATASAEAYRTSVFGCLRDVGIEILAV